MSNPLSSIAFKAHLLFNCSESIESARTAIDNWSSLYNEASSSVEDDDLSRLLRSAPLCQHH